MTNTILYILWGFFYIACGGLGFIVSPEGFDLALCMGCSLLFFVPPFVLLYRAGKTGERKPLRLIRNLSIIWLSVTLLMLILNIASVAMSEQAGIVLYNALIVLCSPMVCGQYWIIALFLWSCLLVASIQELKKLKR